MIDGKPLIIPLWEEPDGHTRALHALEHESHGALEHYSTRASHEPYALHEATPAKSDTLQAVVDNALAYGAGALCMFTLARSIKAFEIATGVPLPQSEFESVLALWWTKAQPSLPADAHFDDYLCDLIAGYSRVKAPLGSHVLENALSHAPALSERPTLNERVTRLLVVCRQLASDNGTFFLSRRDTGRILGTSDPHRANNVITMLIAQRVLEVVEKGTAKGRRATRYRFCK